jgi:hypothetical protein
MVAVSRVRRGWPSVWPVQTQRATRSPPAPRTPPAAGSWDNPRRQIAAFYIKQSPSTPPRTPNPPEARSPKPEARSPKSPKSKSSEEVLQRQRSQNLTSASGDAIWGAHRPNYIRGQFGGIFFVPQVPPPPRCTPVVIPTKLTSRLSLAPCCACQPSFCHIQAAPRRALAPVESPLGLVIWPVTGTQTGRLPASLAKAFKSTSITRGPTYHARGPALTRSRSRGYRDESRRSLTSPSFR